MIAKFDGLEPWRCVDTKGIVAPELGPKSFGTFEKQTPGCYNFFKCISLFEPTNACEAHVRDFLENPKCVMGTYSQPKIQPRSRATSFQWVAHTLWSAMLNESLEFIRVAEGAKGCDIYCVVCPLSTGHENKFI